MLLGKEGEKKTQLGEIDWKEIKKIMRYHSGLEEVKNCSKLNHSLSEIDNNGKSSNDVCTSSKYCKECHILYYWD
tara:strand:- start:331 stop:555 length:225 start_codon:yes stop_codon:yes gene_type:complete